MRCFYDCELCLSRLVKGANTFQRGHSAIQVAKASHMTCALIKVDKNGLVLKISIFIPEFVMGRIKADDGSPAAPRRGTAVKNGKRKFGPNGIRVMSQINGPEAAGDLNCIIQCYLCLTFGFFPTEFKSLY